MSINERTNQRSRAALVALTLAAPIAAHQEDVVAELTLDAPEADEFILHGTVPVPRGTLLPGDAASPLTILDPDGTVVTTQAEIVSRYARGDFGADVVELTARVHRPQGAAPGDRIAYEVVQRSQAEAELHLHEEVAGLLETEGAFRFESQDVFGHSYVADLGQALRAPHPSLHRDGPLVREVEAHRVMLPTSPVEGDLGTLPHLMGVHAWVRTFDRVGFVLLDLEVHNGLDGRDEDTSIDDLLDRVYFYGLALRLPPPWRVLPAFEYPGSGPAEPAGPLVDHMLLDKDRESIDMMPRQARMVRRFALALPGWEERARAALEEEGLGFVRRGTSPGGEDLWSWWNSETARYFPQNQRLPELDHIGLATLRAKLAGELAGHEKQIEDGTSGSYPFLSAQLGWAHPWGVPYGGMSGGDEIHPWDGLRTAAAGSREGYRLAQLITRAYSDRQVTALYDADGVHTEVEDLLEEGPNGAYSVCGFYIQPSSGFGFEDAPTFQTQAVARMKLVERWHENLDAWYPIDLQHYVRYTRNLKVLAWLGNDSLAKHLLVSAAEVFHLSFHRYPIGQWGYVPNSGLLAKQNGVSADPGEGIDLGRGNAWGLDCAAAAYAIADPAWREGKLDWFHSIGRLVEDGQSNCTGNIQAAYFGKLFGGRLLARRANESAYLEHALIGVNETVFRGEFEDRARITEEVIVRSVKAGVLPPFWSEKSEAVWWSVGVSPVDTQYPEFCRNVPRGAYDGYQTGEHSWNSLAYAFTHTGNHFFLDRASQLSGGKLWQDLHEGGEDWLESRAIMLALVQSLSGN